MSKTYKIMGATLIILTLLISGAWAFDVFNLNDNYYRNEDLSKSINEENSTNNLDLNEKIKVSEDNNHEIRYNENSTHLILTGKSTFIKSSIGNSRIKLEVLKNTTVQLSFIINETNIDTGYAIMIPAKNAIGNQGVEFWEDYFFWKQNEIIWEELDHSTRNVQMKSGTYDLFILSNFGKWGLTIESDLIGIEYEYEMPIMEDVIFKTKEFGKNDDNITPFKREIEFKETVFEINSNGMLFRFFYLHANLDGQGIDSIEIESKLYDPNGNNIDEFSIGHRHIYHDDSDGLIGYGWDAIYAANGQWKGSGNCTIKTNGTPNIENFNAHMFEFIINF